MRTFGSLSSTIAHVGVTCIIDSDGVLQPHASSASDGHKRQLMQLAAERLPLVCGF